MEKFFTIKGDAKENNNKLFARFGFKLISINKPANEDEEKEIQKIALAWHQNLFNSISSGYRKDVQLNLKYISGKHNDVQCFLIFTIFTKDSKQRDTIIANIQHDLSPFFTNVNDDISPYLFEQITDIDFLSAINN